MKKRLLSVDVTLFDGAEATDVPTEFVAVTVNVCWPAGRSRMVHESGPLNQVQLWPDEPVTR